MGHASICRHQNRGMRCSCPGSPVPGDAHRLPAATARAPMHRHFAIVAAASRRQEQSAPTPGNRWPRPVISPACEQSQHERVAATMSLVVPDRQAVSLVQRGRRDIALRHGALMPPEHERQRHRHGRRFPIHLAQRLRMGREHLAKLPMPEKAQPLSEQIVRQRAGQIGWPGRLRFERVGQRFELTRPAVRQEFTQEMVFTGLSSALLL